MDTATRRGGQGEGGVKTWTPLRFGLYNIRNSRKGGLTLALRGMAQANLDLGVLQEIKITNGVYTCGSDVYSVVAMEAPS